MTDLSKSFMDLGLSELVLRAIDDMGYTVTTPVQAQAIPMALGGKDMIAQAQTGTGKTAAFGIPIVERVDVSNPSVQAVVLAPTRELACQVSQDLAAIGKYRQVRVAAIYGGEPIRKQIQQLARGTHVVVGTPGRIIDHLRRGTLRFGTVRMAVLDEADEMLDMGFIDDIRSILRHIPRSRQTMLFSATMPPPIARLAASYMVEPEQVNLSQSSLLVAETEHHCFEVGAEQAFDALCDLIDYESITRGLVFCNTRRETDELAARLKGQGYAALALHADMSQEERTRAMNKFREGELELLVATDVAARGIDVFDVTHVVNYQIPLNPETYLHRIGRTGRAGRRGQAITFIRPGEFHDLHRIQEGIDVWIEPSHLPDPHDIEQMRRARSIERRIAAAPEEDLEAFLGEAGYLLDRFGAERVAAVLLQMVWSAGAGREATEQAVPAAFPDSGASPGMVRFVVSVGRKHIRVPDLSRSIAGYTGMPRDEVGAIRMSDSESTVEVPSAYAEAVLKNVNGGFIRGRRVSIELASPSHGKDRNHGRRDRGHERFGRRHESPPPAGERHEGADISSAPDARPRPQPETREPSPAMVQETPGANRREPDSSSEAGPDSEDSRGRRRSRRHRRGRGARREDLSGAHGGSSESVGSDET